MATVTINILDSNGNVIEQKEIQDWQLEQYQTAGYNVQTLDTQPTTIQTITTEAQNILSNLGLVYNRRKRINNEPMYYKSYIHGWTFEKWEQLQ